MIIFLNATSSSGKSSVAEELQKQCDSPLLHFGIDTLFDALPKRFVGQTEEAKQGFFYDMTGGTLQKIEVGPFAHRLLCCTVLKYTAHLRSLSVEKKNAPTVMTAWRVYILMRCMPTVLRMTVRSILLKPMRKPAHSRF